MIHQQPIRKAVDEVKDEKVPLFKNIMSFIAKILASGLIYTSVFVVLITLLPFKGPEEQLPFKFLDSLRFVALMLLFVKGILIAIGFSLLQKYIPYNSRLVKGLVFGFIVLVGVTAAQILALIAFDYKGGASLLTPGKTYFYLQFLTDGIADVITCLILGFMIGTENTHFKPSANRSWALLMGTIVFPLLTFVIGHGMGSLIPYLNYLTYPHVPKGASLWSPWVFYLFFSLTGAILVWTYSLIYSGMSGTWLKKSLTFATIFYFCFWLVDANFMPCFGFSVWSGIILSIETAVPIVVVSLFSAWLLEKA